MLWLAQSTAVKTLHTAQGLVNYNEKAFQIALLYDARPLRAN